MTFSHQNAVERRGGGHGGERGGRSICADDSGEEAGEAEPPRRRRASGRAGSASKSPEAEMPRRCICGKPRRENRGARKAALRHAAESAAARGGDGFALRGGADKHAKQRVCKAFVNPFAAILKVSAPRTRIAAGKKAAPERGAGEKIFAPGAKFSLQKKRLAYKLFFLSPNAERFDKTGVVLLFQETA
jgi:hypothetical protein